MTSSNNNKNADKDEWIQWIENGISNKYINYHEYNEFQNIQCTGSGAFSEVYKANWKSSNTVVALKSFRSEKCIMKEIVNELQLLHEVHFHANIIRLFGITKSNSNMDPDYSFILEYADSGTLRNYLKDNFNKLDWTIKLQFAIQIADAVSCIHRKDIIHRDLHSGNILVHQNIIKLADFGLSCRLNEVSDSSKYILGKVPYVDPQHFKCQKASKKSDVYSVGVLLWEISSGQKPFEYYDSSPIRLMNEILNGKREPPVSDTPIGYMNIYERCWQYNPDDRPDIQQVLSDLKLINLNAGGMTTLPTSENKNTVENNILKNNDNDSFSDTLQMNLDELTYFLRQTNEREKPRKSKRIKISHSAVNLSNGWLKNIANIFFSNTKIKEESSNQQERKFILCKEYEINIMKENFPYWTSENKDIDELIQYTQLNATKARDYLEWIPFEEFEMIKYIGSGGFSCVYSALWMKGPRYFWDNSTQERSRNGPTNVALKRLNNSQNISSSYINQIKAYHKCLQSTLLTETFGITKDSTSNYMIVMKYYENENLYKYLDRNNGILPWKDMIDMLWGIAEGLDNIHNEGKVHGNLHGGNLFIDIKDEKDMDARIGDVGLHGPCDYDENRNQRYGVLPYVAPEVLRGESYSTASDIYSFGIVMNTLASGKRPWYNRAHDINLAKDICDGKRLEIPEDTPKSYAELMKKCWDNDPGKRPTASYLYEKLGEWVTSICGDLDSSEISDEISIAEEKRGEMISQVPKKHSRPEIHPEAYYTSRSLYFPII